MILCYYSKFSVTNYWFLTSQEWVKLISVQDLPLANFILKEFLETLRKQLTFLQENLPGSAWLFEYFIWNPSTSYGSSPLCFICESLCPFAAICLHKSMHLCWFDYDAKGHCESISHQNRKVVAKEERCCSDEKSWLQICGWLVGNRHVAVNMEYFPKAWSTSPAPRYHMKQGQL